jgi:uncharacterized protein
VQHPLWILVPIAIQAAIHYYLWRRLVRDTGLPRPWRTAATVAIVVLALTLPLAMAVGRRMSPDDAGPLVLPGFLWMTLSGLMLVGFAAFDLVRLAAGAVRRARNRPPPDPGRRRFVARAVGGAVAGAATLATGRGMINVLGGPEIREVPIALSRLPSGLDGFTIVQLTDLHIGYTIDRGYITDLVERTNALRPDLIALTGDLVDGTVGRLADAIEPLAHLQARHGVHFVTGNHEYYAGVEPWLAHLRRLGVKVLRNERVEIAEAGDVFDLAGVDDHEAARFGNGHGADLAGAVAGRDPDRELVLLAHQPRQVHEARAHGVGLQLSGHTHGGQIWPWHFLVAAQQGGLDLVAGHGRHGDTQLYISRGAGYWGPPVRLAAPGEISKIVLRSGGSRRG